MLTYYLTQTQRLLQNPPASTQLYSTADLTAYINTARSQLAGESECIRNYATLPLTNATQQYPFSSIVLSGGPASVSGVQGVFKVNQALVQVGSGATWIRPRSFEWFTYFDLNAVTPASGRPNEWAQFGQGVTGSIFVNPIPATSYTLNLDTTCYPINLVTDATVEAIPYPWTDAVPFFAAYLGYLSAQRAEDANKMFDQYQLFTNRGRKMSNPEVMPYLYPQSSNPAQASQLGLQPARGGGG